MIVEEVEPPLRPRIVKGVARMEGSDATDCEDSNTFAVGSKCVSLSPVKLGVF